jgi:membrane-associated phospholipid phosphatase
LIIFLLLLNKTQHLIDLIANCTSFVIPLDSAGNLGCSCFSIAASCFHIMIVDSAIRQPSPQEYLLPFTFLCVLAGVAFGCDQHEQVLVEKLQGPHLSFPVWFKTSGNSDRIYCYPEDIQHCRQEPDALQQCCGFLRDGKPPGASVSSIELLIIVVVVLLAVIGGSCGISVALGNRSTTKGYRWKHATAELNAVLYGVVLAASIMLCLMVFFKKTLGSPRPNFYSLTAMVEFNNHTYHALLEERYQNEPSGHASVAVNTMLYLSFYLHSKWHVYMPVGRNPWHNTLRQFGLTACYIPFVFSMWVAGTR